MGQIKEKDGQIFTIAIKGIFYFYISLIKSMEGRVTISQFGAISLRNGFKLCNWTFCLAREVYESFSDISS